MTLFRSSAKDRRTGERVMLALEALEQRLLLSVPTINNFNDTVNPVTRPNDITLRAAGVKDTDGYVVKVEFYRDDGDGVLNVNLDTMVGDDTNLGGDSEKHGGWAWTGPTAGWPVGTLTFFAVAQDNDGNWSAPISTTGTVLDAAPVVGGVTNSPDPVTRPGPLTLTATGVSDVDGTVTKVSFYRDDGDGIFNSGLDQLIGDGTESGGDWALAADVTGWPTGPYTVFAVAQDNDGTWGAPASTTGTVLNAKPVVGGLNSSPDPVTRPGPLTLTATGVSDVDGTVAKVSFYRDDGDGIFDPGVDQLLGDGTDAGGDWTLGSVDVSGWALGPYTVFAVAQDNEGAVSDPASANGTVVNARPVIASLDDSPDPVTRPDPLTLTATGVTHADGTVVLVEFYRDANGDGILQSDTDVLLGTDTDGSDGWSWTGGTSGWPVGAQTYFARAQGDHGDWSDPAVTAGTVLDAAPAFSGVVINSPDPVIRPAPLTLTVPGVSDADGTVTKMEFYRDANGDGVLQPGSDVLLGTDTDGSDGWSWTGGTSGWPVGLQTYFVRAQDNDGVWSDPISATGSVQYRHIGTIAGPGGVMVDIYDCDDTVDVTLSNIAVKFGKSNSVKSIGLGGTERMTGLGIAISGASSVGSIKDARKGPLGDVGFIASNAAIKSIQIRGGMNGFDVNGLTLGGLTLSDDIDSDGNTSDANAIYSGGAIGKASFGGAVTGDVWIGGANSKGQAFGSFTDKKAGYHGDFTALGGGGTFSLGGNFGSSLDVQGSLSSFQIKGGNFAGELDVTGSLGKFTVAGGKGGGGGLYVAGSNVNVGGLLGSVAVSSVETGNGGNAFGLFAGSFGSIALGPWQIGPADLPFGQDDLRVNLVP